MPAPTRPRGVLGRRIAAQCLLHNMTMAELAAAIGVNPKTLSGYVRGHVAPRRRRLLAMAAHLGVSVEYLLGRTDVP